MKSKKSVLGISCYYHDSAATIIIDGQIVAAAAEERFSRKKHDNGFPLHAITFCLNKAGLAMNEVDIVIFYEKPILKFERVLHQHLEHFPKSYFSFLDTAHNWINTKLRLQETLKEKFHYCGKLFYLEHHLSHAASAYYLSGFSDAVIVTIDGVGEWSTTTVGRGTDSLIKIDKEIYFPHSLGLLYSAITSYLGFSVNDAEYKVMGLAAYGNAKTFQAQFNELVQQSSDGGYALNMKYFDFDWSDHMFSKKLVELFGYPARAPESAATPEYQDIAAALQAKLEEVVIKLLNSAYKKYQCPQLCMAGGVSLNSVLNGKILSRTLFKQIFIPPDPGDAGGSMGAALWAYFNIVLKKETEQKKKNLLKKIAHSFHPYLGPEYDWVQIQKVIKKNKLQSTFFPSRDKLIQEVCDAIIDQKVIGWFQKGMEWGPRALGARSILASAARPEMKDIINARVKHRELFRPFAPVILEEKAKQYFVTDSQLSRSARWMLMVYPFKKRGLKEVPAVVHVDNTGRLQTLRRQDNPLYYDLIKRHGEMTGTPIIINTSFNVRGEPIVCTPQDAINCFLATDIDILVMDNYIIRKKQLRRKKHV